MLSSIIFKVVSFIAHLSSFLLYSKHVLNQSQSYFEGHLSLYYKLCCLPVRAFSLPLLSLSSSWILFSLSSLWIPLCCLTTCVNFLFTACQQITCQTSVGILWFFLFLTSKTLRGVNSIRTTMLRNPQPTPVEEVRVAFGSCKENSGISGDISLERFRTCQA